MDPTRQHLLDLWTERTGYNRTSIVTIHDIHWLIEKFCDELDADRRLMMQIGTKDASDRV